MLKGKRKKLVVFVLLFLFVFPIGTKVFADHDEREHDEDQYEQFQKSDEDEQQSGNQWLNPFDTTQELWNIWSREPRNNRNNPLPVTQPGDINVLVESTENRIYVIPYDGQLLVSCDEIANVLGARSQFYQQSKICKLSKNKRELIVRAGFNTAFENKVKTPMPTAAKAYENSLYVPISVAANSLGYRVLWDENKKVLVLQAL